MERSVNFIIKRLIEKEIIERDETEVFSYVITALLEQIAGFGTMLCIGIVRGRGIPTILFLLTFSVLRKRTGGYHMSSSLQCYVASNLLYIGVSELLCPWMEGKRILYLMILLWGWITILLWAPVNHPNLHLNQEEAAECRRGAVYRMGIITITMLIFYTIGVREEYLTYAATGVGIDAILICIAKICRQEVKGYGKQP